MNTQVLQGLLVPFLGTTLGAALVFFLKRDLPEKVQKGLSGFAAGVMVAASIWSLLIPALEGRGGLGRMVVPARDDWVLAWDSLPASAGSARPPRPPGRRTGGAARVAPPVDDGCARRRAA